MSDHRRRVALACFATALLAALPAPAATPVPADLVLTGGRIYTADHARTIASAMAVRDGTLVYVGADEGAAAFVGPSTRIEPLSGRLVLPGLFDSHLHPAGIVDLDVCDLKSQGKSLVQMTGFIRGCIKRYMIKAGEWVIVRQWNFSNGNEPDAAHPTLRAALDLATRRHPVVLVGNDGHHGAFNSMALARATDAAGRIVGYSKATLAGPLREFRNFVGVDVVGEPNGTVNEDARSRMAVPSMLSVDFKEMMKAPERVTQRLNSVGITGILEAALQPETIELYDTLERTGRLSVRATLAQYFDPDTNLSADGKPDWDKMVLAAQQVREKYAHDSLLRANVVKLFADGVLEGNPFANPPTLPEVATIKPYLQPIFSNDKSGRFGVTGYVDTTSPLCVDARAHADRYMDAKPAGAFLKEHGFHPGQCRISLGELQHDRAVIMEFVRRFHLAGFAVHIHAIGDMPIRTAVDAIEAARKADGIATQHDALAHIQLVHPDDVARIGRDHLYLAFTYAWAYTDPQYDLSVVPFFDHVVGSDHAALHPADGYYERNAYPVKSLKDAGAVLVAGSDAPVDTRDPRPFVNMAAAILRSLPGQAPLNPRESVSIRDVIDAYTINGAQYLERDAITGSIERGKSADFIVLDRDILALADGGNAQDIRGTQVLETWFMGREVYRHRE